MAYNPYNAPYSGYYNPYQYNNPYANMQPQQQTQPMQQPQAAAPNMMTPPTIHAEIVQVDNEQAAANYPVGAGQSQMMMSKDDSAIFVKTALQNGQCALDVFIKRAPEPPKPAVNLDNYITREEFEQRINALSPAPAASAPATRRTAKKEAEADD